jgi:CHASE2 domain-containing sensor protein
MIASFRTLQRSVVLLASALVVGYLIGALKIVEKAERGVTQLFSFTAFTASHDDHIVVVAITDENYREQFGAQSPLRREPLLDLLNSVAAYQPAVIGVDVDSSALTDTDTVRGGVPVIWARDAFVDEDARLTLEPLRASVSPNHAGIAVLSVDGDGTQRKYQRWMKTVTETPEPSFSYQVARTWRSRQSPRSRHDADEEARFTDLDATRSTEKLFIDYARFPQAGPGGCPAVAAARVVQGAPRAFRPRCVTARQVLESTRLTDADRATWAAALGNKVVLVGGTYAHGGDTSHSTPVGGLAGVEIMAQIAATEMEGRGRRPLPMYGALVFFVLLAYLAVPLEPPLSAPRRLVRTLAVGSVAALLASILVHGSIWFAMRYLLVFVCVLILQSLAGFLKSVTSDAAHTAADVRRYCWERLQALLRRRP